MCKRGKFEWVHDGFEIWTRALFEKKLPSDLEADLDIKL